MYVGSITKTFPTYKAMRCYVILFATREPGVISASSLCLIAQLSELHLDWRKWKGNDFHQWSERTVDK